jgi:predicted O-methyltransferase YrrM
LNEQTWEAVDSYVEGLLIGEDPILQQTLQNSLRAGLPQIAVSPSQGKLLHLLALIHRARAILEFGTLGAYSTIWLARALPQDGRIITLEIDPHYAEVAKANIARAGLEGKVQMLTGPALRTLECLDDQRAGPFDLVFIDADKENTPEYFKWSLGRCRKGSVIVTDNVIRGGAIIEPANNDPRVQGMRRFHELLAAQPTVSATTIQTVGSKGYDGFTLALLTADAQP